MHFLVGDDCNKYSNNKAIIMLSLKYPQFNLGFSWIVRLRCGYKYNTTIAIRMGRVSEDCHPAPMVSRLNSTKLCFAMKYY